jgi:hypothetical protein
MQGSCWQVGVKVRGTLTVPLSCSQSDCQDAAAGLQQGVLLPWSALNSTITAKPADEALGDKQQHVKRHSAGRAMVDVPEGIFQAQTVPVSPRVTMSP